MNVPYQTLSPSLSNQMHLPYRILHPSQITPTRNQLHALIISSGLHHPYSNLASVYSLHGNIINAHHLFDRIPQKTTPLYNALIQRHIETGQHLNALQVFAEMLSNGLRADNFTYPFALRACRKTSNYQLGCQIHCSSFLSGYVSNEYVQNCLIAMYMSCGRVEDASLVFDEMGNRDCVSWNTMISGLFQNGCADEALDVFDEVVNNDSEIDQATVVSVLPVCAQLKDLKKGRLVHKLVMRKGFDMNLLVRNALIDMYGKCGSLDDARRVFEENTMEKDVVSWTSMIGGCTLNGNPEEALNLFRGMQLSGIRPNLVTFASLLSACGTLPSIHHGTCIHGSCIKLGLRSNIVIETALIDMYSKCDSMDLSSQVFEWGWKQQAAWNAVISGFARNGKSKKSITYFKRMLAEGVEHNFTTIASVLPAYSHSPDLRQAKNIHCYLTRLGFLKSIEVTTGLIDVYAKVGYLDVAWNLFDGLSIKDTVSWSAIIGGYGMHGHARTAIWLLDQMMESNFEPNEVTFTCVLQSCSHAGLVDEGLKFFERMIEVHHLIPKYKHYTCIVDLLGRAGRLQKAYEVIKSMPFEVNHAVWGALLGACAIYEDVELGEVAAERLFKLEPENMGNYVILGNIYAAVGRWEDAEELRRVVREKRMRKEPGFSLIEAKNLFLEDRLEVNSQSS